MVVAAIVVAMLAIVSAMFLQVRPLERSESYAVPLEDGMEDVRLMVMSSLGEVEVGFAELGGDAVQITTHVSGTAGLFGNDDPMKANISHVIDPVGGGLNVTALLDVYAPWPYYSLDDVRCEIVIDNRLAADINITVVTGGATVRTAEGTTITGLSIDSTSLGSVVALNNGTVLAGDVRIRTATGGSAFYWNNLTVVGDRTIEVEESSGELLAVMSQAREMGGSVIMSEKGRGGPMTLQVDIGGDVSASLTASSSLGTVELNAVEGFRGQDGVLVSDNHPGASHLDIRMNNTVGRVEAWCRWSP